MSLLMTATPVAMHEVDGFNMQDTAFVIQSHIMAMFLPSLVTGVLIDRYGAPLMIAAGAVILGACLVIGFIDHQLIHYWWALVLLGVGWNFMQLGGTALLTTTYEPSEQFKVQAFNDFTVFTLQAVAALSSGYLLLSLGWHFLIYFSVPLLALPLIFLAIHQPRPAQPVGRTLFNGDRRSTYSLDSTSRAFCCWVKRSFPCSSGVLRWSKLCRPCD